MCDCLPKAPDLLLYIATFVCGVTAQTPQPSTYFLEAGTRETLLVEAILGPDIPPWIAERRSEHLPPKKGPARVA